MKTKAVFAVVGFAAAVLALPAAAQMRSAGSGYLGLGVGQSDYKFSCPTGPCDHNGRAFKLFGGYQFHPNVAGEFGYADLGKSTNGTANVASTLWELSAVGSYPVAPAFSVFGRLGAYDAEVKATVPSTGAEAKATRIGLTWGIGGQMDLTRDLAVRAEWQSYSKTGGGDLGEKADINVLSVGALWRFQ